MPPTNPCTNCVDEGLCPIAGQMNRMAMMEWIDDRFFECPEFREKLYHGLEGCHA